MSCAECGLFLTGCSCLETPPCEKARKANEKLQDELVVAKQEGDTMWEGLNHSIADLQAELASYKLFVACNHKGTFHNCNPSACTDCHSEQALNPKD